MKQETCAQPLLLDKLPTSRLTKISFLLAEK
jgi:hypothetical protein